MQERFRFLVDGNTRRAIATAALPLQPMVPNTTRLLFFWEASGGVTVVVTPGESRPSTTVGRPQGTLKYGSVLAPQKV